MFSLRLIVLLFVLLLAGGSLALAQDPGMSASAGLDADVVAAPAADGDLQAAAARPSATLLGNAGGWHAMSGHESSALTRLLQRLGDPRVLGSALVTSYVTGHVPGLPDVSAASARVAGATYSAAVISGALQSTVGRMPGLYDGGVPDEFHLFKSPDGSFPSARSTVACATAAAIHAEARARWVPWVVYPAAAAVTWADVNASRHGSRDALAGAALGLGVGHVVDRFERSRLRFLERSHFFVRGPRHDLRLGFRTRF